MPFQCFPTHCALRLVLCTLPLLAAAGCSGPPSSMPPVFPVKGTVHYKGGVPVVGGAIQFMSISDTSYSISGEIGEDGSFALYTVKGSERVQGAPEGTYKVTIQPPIGTDHRPVQAIALSDNYHIEPKENSFTIEVNPPSKK